MADSIGSAASLLVGNPEPTAPDQTQGGAPAAPPPAPTPDAGNWTAGLDPEIQEWAGKKGWKSPAEALVSHRNLEKYLGGEKLPVPKGADDAAAWDMVYKALGRPDLPDGYGLDKIEGFDPEFAKAAASTFHKAGLTAAQAAQLAEWHKSIASEQIAKMDAAFLEQSQVDLQALQSEWGQSFTARTDAARRAALQFGMTADVANKMERALGTKGMLELMANIGMKMTESPSIGMTRRDDALFMTPEEAKRQISDMKADPDMAKRLYNGDSAARSQLERLQKIAAGVA